MLRSLRWIALAALVLAACGTPPTSTADAGDGPADASVPMGDPIGAAPETWTWVDFPDTQCGNGQPTGLAVNLTSRSKDVLVYVEGGGACWDYATCFTYNTAINIRSGYTKQSWLAETWGNEAMFDRTDVDNPFKDASFVFVPYCTGDIHAGDSVRTYDPQNHPTQVVHHKGAPNMEAYLKRLAATFQGAGRVWLSGSSAGGYGAQFNYPRVAAAFPGKQVHALADCSPLVASLGGRYEAWLSAWKVAMPTGCTDCATSPGALIGWLSASYPNGRFGLLDYRADNVIRQFFGYSTTTDFELATDALLAARYDPSANARYFQLPGNSHVMLIGFDVLTQPTAGISLKTWIAHWANGDATWANAR
jgi:hypothetical protein